MNQLWINSTEHSFHIPQINLEVIIFLVVFKEIYTQKFCAHYLCLLFITCKEYCRMRTFKNRVKRTVLAARREEALAGWTKLHHEELHYCYLPPNMIKVIKWRRIRWVRHVTRMGENKKHTWPWRKKTEGKKPPGRYTRRWEDSIKTDIKKIRRCGVDWINLTPEGGNQQAVYMWVSKTHGVYWITEKLLPF